MQLRKTNLLLAAVFATSLVLTACGDESGGENLSCNEDGDCADTEICSAGYCMQTCDTADDCPDTNKNCSASTGSTQKICRCQTDSLCNGGDAEGGLTCTASGACTSDTGPASCTGEGQGTGTSQCTYGTQFCSTGTCTALAAPTCDNYTNFANKTQLGTSGPIIYSVTTGTVTTDTTYCGTSTPKRVRIIVNAYNDEAFPATKDELAGLFYVTQAGADTDATDLISSSAGNYTRFDNNRRAQMTVSLCVTAANTSTSTGFYFTGGNFFCHLASHP